MSKIIFFFDLCLLAFVSSAFAISSLAVMADNNMGVAMAAIARDYSRDHQVAIAGDNMDEARKFLAYLKSPATKKLLRDDGFMVD